MPPTSIHYYERSVSLSNPEWRQRYKDEALMSVRASRPWLPSVGNKVNRLYEAHGLNHSNGFEHFVSLFEEMKAPCNSTIIYS